MLNINNSTDPFYRYKMEQPKYELQKQFLVCTNFVQICKSIARPPETVKAFLKKQLGANLIFKSNILFFPNTIPKTNIQSALKQFIESHVLCPNCGCPETIPTIETATRTCQACGHTSKN